MAPTPASVPTLVRGVSAKSYLSMEWEYVVYTAPVKEAKSSTAKAVRRALSRAEAFAYISGDDPRPLLVLRECKTCNGTDDALLKGGIDNEATMLLSRWFHCVKLPVDVMEEDHPFHNLFQLEKTEHLFIASPNGDNHDPLESQTSRTELWDSLRDLVAREYTKKPESSLKAIAKILNKMDTVDGALRTYTGQRDKILVEDGPGSRKLKKLQKKIDKAMKEREELHDKMAKASGLELKRKKQGETQDA